MVRKLIEWGEPSELQNAKGYPLFKEVELEWSRPTLWTIDQSVPDFDTNDPFLYILLRNHGNLSEKNKAIVGKLNNILINFLKNQRYWDIDLEHHSN